MNIFSLLLCFMLIGASNAYAQLCEASIEANDSMQFDKKEITISKDCTQVKLTLTYKGTLPKAAMRHNWVVAASKDMQSLVSDAIKFASNDYLPPKDKRVIAATKLIGSGESSSVTFNTDSFKSGSDYKYFCTYPGHSSLMVGSFLIK